MLNQADTNLPEERHDFVIGVDGGCRWCMDNHQPVDLAIGDFDSLDTRDLQKLSSRSVEIERHPEDKDHTDLELALIAAMKRSPSAITVHGVWGGRIDHSLANLLCIAVQSGQVPVAMHGSQQSGYLIKNRQTIIFNAEMGQCVSLLALCMNCTGVSNSGFKFPLNDALIEQGTGIGLSNLTTAPVSEISLQAGILLILTSSKCAVRIISNR